MPFLGKEILLSSTLKRKPIYVDEWGGEVLLRELTGREAEPVQQGAVEIQFARQKNEFSAAKAMTWQAKTVALGWINEDGTHVLETKDLDDFIKATPSAIIVRLAREVRILSGLEAATDNEDESPVEDAKKNSTRTRNTASGSN